MATVTTNGLLALRRRSKGRDVAFKASRGRRDRGGGCRPGPQCVWQQSEVEQQPPPAPAGTSQFGRGGVVQGLHGPRHRRRRRQVVQPVVVGRACRPRPRRNPNIKISYVPSNSQNDYAPNLAAESSKGCKTIIAVGGLMADAVKAAAKKNPTQQFAEVDAPSPGPNVYGLQYNTAQGGFLGGYLAAGMTKTGKVATYGGLNIPPVTIYMDGFWEGVQYYNTAEQQEGPGARLEREATRRAARSPNSLHRPEQGQADQPGLHPAGRGHHLPGRRRHRPRLGCGGAGQRRQGQR